MNDAQFAELVAWIAEEGLAGEEEPELVSGFCTRAVAFGLPLMRAAVLIDTLHPLYEGHFFGWQADGKTTLREYGSSREGEGQERWLRSPFYRLVESGEPHEVHQFAVLAGSGGISVHRRPCSRRHRICRDGSPFQGAGHHRRDGLRLLVLGDGPC